MSVLQDRIERLGVHPALGPVGEGWGIEQNPYELAAFLAEISPIETCLELGTGLRAGFARFATEVLGWQVWSVDKNAPQASASLVHFIQMTTESAIDLFKDMYFDLVLIDADHRYEAVKRDYELYKKLGNIVAFHDIAGLRDCEGVARFWREIAYTKKGQLRQGFHEAIADDEFRSGIGWITR